MAPTLVELVSQDVALKRLGKSRYAGKCPFHVEKTPSFHVYDAGKKWRYHCHGCGADGDAIDWLRTMRRLTYRQAVATLGTEPSKPSKPAAPRIPEASEVELLDWHTSAWRRTAAHIRRRNPNADLRWLAKYDCPLYGWACRAFVKADAATLAARPKTYRREYIQASESDKTVWAFYDRNPDSDIPYWAIEVPQ